MRYSVIIPVYNVVGFVGSCLDSIVAAAGDREVEIICVDDGSTDGSGKVLDEYAEKFKLKVQVQERNGDLDSSTSTLNFKVIHQANAGVSAARNRGLEAATGGWLIFVDSDDLVRETLFETVEAGIARDPSVDLVCFGVVADYVDTPVWRDGAATWRDVGIDVEITDGFDSMSVYRFAYRRDRFGAIRFLPLAYGEDLMYVIEALSLSRRCQVTDRPEYAYRWREGSASHNGLNPRAVGDLIRFNVASFRRLDASGKRIARGFIERRGGIWIEELPRVIAGHWGDPVWDGLWADWLDSMSVAADLPCLTDRQRHRARCVAKARTHWSVRLHCLLPAWLRRKGLWRCR